MAYWISIPIVLLFAFVVFRVFVRRDYLQRKKLGPLATFLEFLIFGLHANLPYLYLETPWPHFPPAPESLFQLCLGAIIALIGLAATLGNMAHLGFGTSVGRQPEGVRQTGIYRWSRNPQLLSYGVMLTGITILYPSLQALAWLFLYAGISYLMVITEEEHLLNLFGEDYQEYCRKVPRLIGLPWTQSKRSK